MYIIIHSLAPFGWEKNGLAEHNDIKAGSIKMHQIYYFFTCSIALCTDLHLTNPKGQCPRQ